MIIVGRGGLGERWDSMDVKRENGDECSVHSSYLLNNKNWLYAIEKGRKVD